MAGHTGIGGYNTFGSSHFSYDLWMPHIKRNGDIKGQNYYAMILIYPDNKTMFEATAAFTGNDL